MKSSNPRAFWNSLITIEDVTSGFTPNGVSFGSIGATSLDAMYTTSDIEKFPDDKVVPCINVRGFYGFVGKWTVLGQLNIRDSMVLAISDTSAGRTPENWTTIKDSVIYPLPSKGEATSRLPRAQYSNCRFVNSMVAPDLSAYDSIIGCTFENGNQPVGVTVQEAFSGVIKDPANRLQ